MVDNYFLLCPAIRHRKMALRLHWEVDKVVSEKMSVGLWCALGWLLLCALASFEIDEGKQSQFSQHYKSATLLFIHKERRVPTEFISHILCLLHKDDHCP
jgi:hypothetical protein